LCAFFKRFEGCGVGIEGFSRKRHETEKNGNTLPRTLKGIFLMFNGRKGAAYAPDTYFINEGKSCSA